MKITAFTQAYNCQAVVDHEHQVIVATRATNVASDEGQAVVMIEEVITNTGTVPKEVSADAGYYSATAVAELQALSTDPFVAPEKTRHCHKSLPAPRGRIPKDLAPRGRMRRKLQTNRGRQRYALRMEQVEPRRQKCHIFSIPYGSSCNQTSTGAKWSHPNSVDSEERFTRVRPKSANYPS